MIDKEPFDKDGHQSYVKDLMRKVIDGIQLGDIDFMSRMDDGEKALFIKYCSEIVTSPYFEQIFSVLYYPHIMAAATKAENYDLVTFHRATANGVSLVKEFFEKYDRLFQDEIEKNRNPGFKSEEPFDESEADEFFRG